MESTVHGISEREILGGILTAIIALAEKLTGERLTVYAQTDIGEVPCHRHRVRWSKDPPPDTRSLAQSFPEGPLLRLSDS